MDAFSPPPAQSFAELVSDGPRMTIKSDGKEPPKQTEIKPTRFVRRCRQRVILQFAEIFEAWKERDIFQARVGEAEKVRDYNKNYYNNSWKEYCGKWNKRKGFPKVDPELFNKQANKYLNELRTVPANATAE